MSPSLPTLLCASSLLSADLAHAAVQILKTSQPPAGYEVTFTYFNASATNVTIGAGLTTFTDQYRTNADGSANWDPHGYQPGWFRGIGQYPDTPYHMVSDGAGNWTYTAPLPSGTYQYAFLVDCPEGGTCNIDNGKYVIDPENPPFENVKGDQVQSRFQVPFDPRFQAYSEMDLDFDYALPVPAGQQGTVMNVNYSSPGSVHPAQDVHDFVVYLPPGYDGSGKQVYPLLYLSHGGGGDAQDWQNLAAVSNILDNLILQKNMTPTVVVMPSFYNIAEEYKQVYGSSVSATAPSSDVVRENYMAYLFPFVEQNFAVSTDPKQRAFAGLSLGSILTYEMYINATDYFSYFGMFSGVRGPGSPASAYLNASMVASNPALLEKGVMSAAGLFDIAFEDTRSLQAALQALQVPFVSRIVPFGFHYWNTWADCLWHFGQKVLWQPLPFEADEVVTISF